VAGRQRRPRVASEFEFDGYHNAYGYGYAYGTTDQDDENDDDDDLSFEVDSFQALQRSTGYEILDDQLQSQIDEATPIPNTFLDTHVTDASFLEKVAMSSVPEQLPQPAVNAFRQQQQLVQQQQQQQQQQQHSHC